MFVMAGAAVEIPPNIYRLLTTFGPKLFFFRLPKSRNANDEYVDDLKSEQFNVKFQKMAEAVDKYLEVFESCPGAEIEDGSPADLVTETMFSYVLITGSTNRIAVVWKSPSFVS